METAPATTVDEVPLEHLEHEICELSAHLAAAMCRWLVLVAECDRRQGWSGWGLRSCAHWLNWKCGLSMVAAHEHVRVARRLVELPAVHHAFSTGQLSYSKARALTRMATPATEAELVELARHATAAHLDRIARARRGVRRADEREEANRRHEARHLHWFWDDDGSLVLTARLDPEEGALVLQALDAAGHALRNRAQTESSSAEDDDAGSDRSSVEDEPAVGDESSAEDGDPEPESSAEDGVGGREQSSAEDDAGGQASAAAEHDHRTAADSRRDEAVEANAAASRRPANRADALVAMAETMLEHGPAARDGGERYQMVVLVGAEVLAGEEGGRCEVEDGPRLAADTALRLACDAAVLAMSLKNGGEPLDVGRSTQAIPRAVRRALRRRDGGCRFPGCTQTRFVDGHHIVHWAQGGPTSLANLVLLCRFHHRAVHEGGYGLVRTTEGELVFTTPAGAVVPPVPEPEPPVHLDVESVNKRLGVVVSSDTGASLWGGERLDVGLAIDALQRLEGEQTGG